MLLRGDLIQRFARSDVAVVRSIHAGFVPFLAPFALNSHFAAVGLVIAFADHVSLCTFHRYAGAGEPNSRSDASI